MRSAQNARQCTNNTKLCETVRNSTKLYRMAIECIRQYCSAVGEDSVSLSAFERAVLHTIRMDEHSASFSASARFPATPPNPMNWLPMRYNSMQKNSGSSLLQISTCNLPTWYWLTITFTFTFTCTYTAQPLSWALTATFSWPHLLTFLGSIYMLRMNALHPSMHASKVNMHARLTTKRVVVEYKPHHRGFWMPRVCTS